MTKTLLTILFATALMMGNPLTSRAAAALETIDNLAGMRVAYLKIDSAEKHFDLGLPKGCYIVKVGKMVRKIAVR